MKTQRRKGADDIDDAPLPILLLSNSSRVNCGRLNAAPSPSLPRRRFYRSSLCSSSLLSCSSVLCILHYVTIIAAQQDDNNPQSLSYDSYNQQQQHEQQQQLFDFTTLKPDPPTAWLTPSSEPSNAARPVMCSIRDSQPSQCNLSLGPDQCGGLNWTSAITFTTLGAEVLGTFVDLPDQPIGAASDPQLRLAGASIAYRMPASKSTGGISVVVVRVSASCCVRRLTVVGYTSAGSADHCNLNLCGHNFGGCQNGGLCTTSPSQCACRAQWTGAMCDQIKMPSKSSPSPTTQMLMTGAVTPPQRNAAASSNSIYWPGAASIGQYQEVMAPQHQQQQNYANNNNNNNSNSQMSTSMSMLMSMMLMNGSSSSSSTSANASTSADSVLAQLMPDRNANQRWCPDKFLCCDHGLAYYDPTHQMMCCNNRAVPVVNFTRACPELASSLRSNQLLLAAKSSLLPMAPTAAMTAAAAAPATSSSGNKTVPPGVVLLAKGVPISSNASALAQRLLAASNGGASPAAASSESDADQGGTAAAQVSGGQDELMEMKCNGITHWVARNNRARFGCCGGKVYDIVWDSCAITSGGLGVVRRIAANGKNSTLNKGENEVAAYGPSSPRRATMVPPPTPMGAMLKNENEARPSANWLQVNVFKKQQGNPSMSPSVQRRRRLISRSRAAAG